MNFVKVLILKIWFCLKVLSEHTISKSYKLFAPCFSKNFEIFFTLFSWLGLCFELNLWQVCCLMYKPDSKRVSILIETVLPTLPMLYLPFNVYLDSKTVSILIEAVLPTLPMLYLPFNVYLDSKTVSILIEAVLPTLPMLYLPFNVYLDSKTVSILIEAVWPTLPMLYLSFNVYLDSKRVSILREAILQ